MTLKLMAPLPPAPAYIITGTDTDVGKTTIAAQLLTQLQGRYWKPIQSGRDPETGRTDTEVVQQTTGLSPAHFLPESYLLKEPLSPHRAAELEGAEIHPKKILLDYQKYLKLTEPPAVPDHSSGRSRGPLLIEGAGGLMVPITRQLLQIDLFEEMQVLADAPIILIARTGLGTINHTLLSVEALRARNLKIGSIIFNGPENEDNVRTIVDFVEQMD